MSQEESKLLGLYRSRFNEDASGIHPLPGSGSYRHYYRIRGRTGTVIGVHHEDRKENLAFLSFTRHFMEEGLPVPQIIAEDLDSDVYLLKDLGDLSLFGFLSETRENIRDFPDRVKEIYRKVIEWLPVFQVRAGKGLDYSRCYPREAFDRLSMRWDLNYFKYYFLKLAKIPFDEQRLEEDFRQLTAYLLKAERTYFMYRDFQSRNIMLLNDMPWFIDYQGGRKGPLQYDIASLLYDGKAAIPRAVRDELLDYYLDVLARYTETDRKVFLSFYHGFVLIRILQALGAYGFRGYYENKPHFLQSIPYAVENLEWLLAENKPDIQVPELRNALRRIVEYPSFRHTSRAGSNLLIEIHSFSYMSGVPQDESGHGGGFVFDCRALPNPGKLEEYRTMTGKDDAVVMFLRRERSVEEFMNHVFSLTGKSIQQYIEREFTHLFVAFGCTGGQHRSVYCAEELAKYIKSRYPVKVRVVHGGLV